MIYFKGGIMMKYEVIDTFGNNVVGVYETREDAIKAIRLYCVEKMMRRVSLFDQQFINLTDNPHGYFPNKPKFLINEV
jgi:hypothetical protein